MADIRTEDVTYTAGGTTLRGFLSHPAAASKAPGVLVVHEWWGLNDYIRRRARMLAELGYTALAVDMYGDGTTASDPAGANALMTAALSDRGALEARFKAALEKLPDDQREAIILIGASGFSYEEAADICGCAIGTIKSRVNRARTRLAELLNVEGDADYGPDSGSLAVTGRTFVGWTR